MEIIIYQTTEYPLSSHVPVTLTLPSGRIQRLIPFQKNNGRWYIRFSCSETGNAILSIGNKNLKLQVRTYKRKNSLFTHGPITRSSQNRYLCHKDGTPFFYLADTWWYAMTNRMSLQTMKTLLADRKKKGFTVVQCVIGGAPEVPLTSSETANAGGLPFTNDHHINPAYFDEVDKKIACTVEAGIIPCIFGSWGYHLDVVGVEGIKELWKEILARYSSYPVIFSLTGEADIFSGHVGRIQKYWRSSKRIAAWNRVGDWVKTNDQYNRILMVHPHSKVRAKVLFHNPSWLDIDTIQTGHSESSIEFMVTSIVEAAKKNIPIINLEPWYEGIKGNFGAYHQRHAFWISMLSGAVGHSYGAHGVWQMARGDDFMGHWGSSDWKQAYKQKGSEEIGHAKQFLSALPWMRLENAESQITYTGSRELSKRPFGGVIDRKYCILYVPDFLAVSNIHVDFPNKPSHIRQIWYDPRTMKPVGIQKLQTKDVVLVISAYE